MQYPKWLSAIPPYLFVYAGLFLFKSAWVAMLGFHLAILLTISVLRPRIPLNILFKTNHPQWIFPAVLLCSSGGVLIYCLYPLLGDPNVLASQLAELGLEKASWFGFIAYFSLINPCVEEYFWRASFGSETKGLYAGDLFYAGYHGLVLAGRTPAWLIFLALTCLVFVGWLWRQVRREDEGLLIPVMSHLAADLSVMIGVYLLTT